VNPLYSLEEWWDDEGILTHRGHLHPWGSKFAPRGEIKNWHHKWECTQHGSTDPLRAVTIKEMARYLNFHRFPNKKKSTLLSLSHLSTVSLLPLSLLVTISYQAQSYLVLISIPCSYLVPISFPSQNHLVPISLPSHSHLVPISFPSRSHLVPISFPSRSHLVLISFPSRSHLVPI
jgi:hypothetical protein